MAPPLFPALPGPFFPALPGQGWSVHKRPLFSTLIAAHVSGREVRRANYAQTLYEFELTFDGLAGSQSFPGLGGGSLETLMGFVLARQGQFGTFLYVDPTDCAATGQPLGLGDGATTGFTLVRTLGAATEPVGWVTALQAVYLAGAAQPAAAASLAAPNTLLFASAPPAGASIAADFTYAFPCRFTEDAQDFENVLAGLWQLGSLKFRSVRS